MMKRLSCILVAALCVSAQVAEAGVVGARRASEAAAEFFGTARVEAVPEDGVKSGASEQAYYVFNNPGGGWVIIAGDDAALPVVAYSLTGAFVSENLPANISLWLEGKETEILAARQSGAVASERVRSAWDSLGEGTKAAGEGKYIETATWSQDTPYNFYCPTISENGKSVKTVTGCVATAMAIVLRHHGYPASGTGKLPSYTYVSDKDKKTVTVNGEDVSSHTYNYTSMPLLDNDVQNASTSKQQNVARLIYDLGVAVQASYNCSTGTSAFAQSIPAALAEHFGYASDAVFAFRGTYGLGDWIALLKSEIDADRPVIYGASNENGHEFVIAGYDSEDLFYVNWGWAGQDNGYYCIKNFEGAEKQYPDNHSAIIGLAPDPEKKTQREDVISFEPMSDNKGITVTSGTVERGSSFMIDASFFYNWSEYPYDNYVRAVLLDSSDSVKCNIGDEVQMTLAACLSGEKHYGSLSSYRCRIDDELVFGDGIGFIYKTNLGNWKLVRYNHEDGLGRLGVYDACVIKLPDGFSAGDVLPLEIMTGQKSVKTVEWYYDGNAVTSGQVIPVVGAHTIKAKITFQDMTSETLVQEITVE